MKSEDQTGGAIDVTMMISGSVQVMTMFSSSSMGEETFPSRLRNITQSEAVLNFAETLFVVFPQSACTVDDVTAKALTPHWFEHRMVPEGLPMDFQSLELRTVIGPVSCVLSPIQGSRSKRKGQE